MMFTHLFHSLTFLFVSRETFFADVGNGFTFGGSFLRTNLLVNSLTVLFLSVIALLFIRCLAVLFGNSLTLLFIDGLTFLLLNCGALLFECR